MSGTVSEWRELFGELERESDAVEARERAHGAGDAEVQRRLRALAALDARLDL